MKSSKINGFTIGMIAVALVLAGAAYMLGYQPLLDAKTESTERAEAAESFNETLRIQLVAKQREAELIPTYEAEIEEIREVLPPVEDLTSMRDELNGILMLENVSLRSLQQEPGRLVIPGEVNLTNQAFAVGQTSTVHELAFQNLIVTEFTLEMSGTYRDIMQVVTRLQFDTERLYLVYAPEIEYQLAAGGEAVTTIRVKLAIFTLLNPDSPANPAVPPSVIDPETGETLDPLVGGDILSPPVQLPAES